MQQGGNWTALVHSPSFGVATMLLLTDGTVLVFEDGGSQTARLTPDDAGEYVDGTWHELASMGTVRQYFASAVLPDGRVFVAGGEYAGGKHPADLTDCEVYDPVRNAWSPLSPPAGWSKVGDAPCAVLPDGRVLLGSINSTAVAIFDPDRNAFSAAASKHDWSSEETWTLLPDQTVLTVECANHPRAEKYVAAADEWVQIDDTPVELVQASSWEIGPAVLLPDGRVWALGATGMTALYTPQPLASDPGTWEKGPTFPTGPGGQPLEAKDAPACLLPNGRVLCAVGPAAEKQKYRGPSHFFEYDPDTGGLDEVEPPVKRPSAPYTGRMLLLPTGQVLYSDGSSRLHLYTPDANGHQPDAHWRPEITKWPSYTCEGESYELHGRLLNGVSQACSYGDDASMATNYPLVRIHTPSGKVRYCRTFGHSTMGVATGLAIHSTNFEVPESVEHGAAELCVVANGIPSECVPVTVGDGRTITLS